MLSATDLRQIELLLDRKLEEKLEAKLEEKLDQKLDEKLKPIKRDLQKLKADQILILDMLDREQVRINARLEKVELKLGLSVREKSKKYKLKK